MITARIIVFLGLCLLSSIDRSRADAWEDSKTHRELTVQAAKKSVLGATSDNYLSNIGLVSGLAQQISLASARQSALLWFEDGAKQEDAKNLVFPLYGTARFLNHFHNPLYSYPWSQAGLFSTEESVVLWAQDGNAQQGAVGGDWSWLATRDSFYLAVTATDNAIREEHFAKTFLGLGHQMHLLQDMAVPDHTRDDVHAEDPIMGVLGSTAFFESWAKKNFLRVNQFAATAELPSVVLESAPGGLVPITQFFDTDIYDGTNPTGGASRGLAEYTNANFVSNDTIFAPEFPYPAKTSTDIDFWEANGKLPETVVAEDGVEDLTFYIAKTSDGEHVTHFLKPGYFSRYVYDNIGGGDIYNRTFYRDETCHSDYASKLVPMAVGYSAGLLDYFFRGSIDILPSGDGTYSMIDASDPGFDPAAASFTTVTLLAQNSTADNEEMTDGSIELVIRYRLPDGDPFEPADLTVGDPLYKVVPEAGGTRSIPRDVPVELVFDPSGDPLPLYAVKISFQIVYRGTLGAETDAVAVGTIPIGDPTPLDVFNNMDKVCIGGLWYDAGSVSAIGAVDDNGDGIAYGVNEWDVYPHEIRELYAKLSSLANPVYASPANADAGPLTIPPGAFKRVMYLLADESANESVETFVYSFRTEWVGTDADDSWLHQDILYAFYGTSIQYSQDPQVCGGQPCTVRPAPDYYPFRGVSIWWGSAIIYDNPEYPPGADCSWNDL